MFLLLYQQDHRYQSDQCKSGLPMINMSFRHSLITVYQMSVNTTKIMVAIADSEGISLNLCKLDQIGSQLVLLWLFQDKLHSIFDQWINKQ
jgi:hypothetical protein